MGKVNFIKNFLFLQGFLLFIIHFIFSPYPLNSIKRFKDSLNMYLKEYKIKNKILKKKIIIDENGYNFKIISFGTKAVDPYYSYFIFMAEKSKIQNYENGLYVVSIPEETPVYFTVKNFDLNKNDMEFIYYIENLIPDNVLLILSFSGFIFTKYNTNLDVIFNKMGAKSYENAKKGYSYILIARKKGRNFVPVREIFSDNKAVLFGLKIKP